MTLAQEKLEARLNAMVNTQIREMRSKVMEIEMSTDKLLARYGEQLETIQLKVDRMEEGHVLREYTDSQV